MIEILQEEVKAGDTKTRILDAAEALFADKGFEATSLRDITSTARVNLAAVNYHFHSKDGLIDAVIARRMQPITKKRLELLDAAGPNPSIDQVVEAFLVPVAAAAEGKMLHLAQMFGRMLATPDQFRERIVSKHLEKSMIRFREAFARAVPHLSERERNWRFHFMAGVLSHVMVFAHILPELSGGLCDLSEPRQVANLMKTFLVGGYQAPATDGRPEIG